MRSSSSFQVAPCAGGVGAGWVSFFALPCLGARPLRISRDRIEDGLQCDRAVRAFKRGIDRFDHMDDLDRNLYGGGFRVRTISLAA